MELNVSSLLETGIRLLYPFNNEEGIQVIEGAISWTERRDDQTERQLNCEFHTLLLPLPLFCLPIKQLTLPLTLWFAPRFEVDSIQWMASEGRRLIDPFKSVQERRFKPGLNHTLSMKRWRDVQGKVLRKIFASHSIGMWIVTGNKFSRDARFVQPSVRWWIQFIYWIRDLSRDFLYFYFPVSRRHHLLCNDF